VKQYFIDSNLIVYANDRRARKKQARAIETVSRLMCGQNGVVSIQVLQEYANVALTKLKQDVNVVLRQVRLLESMRTVIPTPDLVRRQIEIRETYRISFWDAGIIAAAEEARCDVVLSEDLNEGQFYAGTPVVNPFSVGFDLVDLSD